MKKEDLPILNQLIESLEENLFHLEEAYNAKNAESFNKSKGIIIQLQKKISEVVR